MNFLFFEEKNAPKRLDKKVTFEVPLDLVIYGSLIVGSFSMLLFMMLGGFL